MQNVGIKNPNFNLKTLGIEDYQTAFWNLSPEELTKITLDLGHGMLTNNGTLVVFTGEFTGRSPQDRFIVKDELTNTSVDWNNINKAFSPRKFDHLYNKVTAYFAKKNIYVRDVYACADENYRLNIRLLSEYAWSNQFAHNMFLRPSQEEIENFAADWTILCAPKFMADPILDGTRQHNFAIINFSKQQIIIGGTGYTGEIKKGIFSVLNFILPTNCGVLPMHCSANMGKAGDTAIFFGLSGTGKTTLSADPNRYLIGDDEHGWSDEGVFNFEGGCYAKTIDLSAEKEPDIFKAVRPGAILENIGFQRGTNIPDYEDATITQNTRVSYPIEHIDNALSPSKGKHPKNIFFLTCDAFGVLPPLSRLTPEQAMYYFISGYTAKVAGTEAGVTEPQATFSACFGAPFLPLHPTVYAEMLGEKMKKQGVKVWLVNTGWTGGTYGIGHRISLKHTRRMIEAVLSNELSYVPFEEHPVFGLYMPYSCPGLPTQLLNPRDSWANKYAYDEKANELAIAFDKNFKKYEDKASEAIRAAAPKILAFA